MKLPNSETSHLPLLMHVPSKFKLQTMVPPLSLSPDFISLEFKNHLRVSLSLSPSHPHGCHQKLPL